MSEQKGKRDRSEGTPPDAAKMKKVMTTAHNMSMHVYTSGTSVVLSKVRLHGEDFIRTF